MKTSTPEAKRITRSRAAVHVVPRQDKSPRVTAKGPTPAELTLCRRCGAVFAGKTWRLRTLTRWETAAAKHDLCPACKAADAGSYFGKVTLRGAFVKPHEAEIRRRIANVARRAAYTQPERRVVDVAWRRGTLEVLTTSEKLAHRIVRELHKAFRGEAAYRWSPRDGSLDATWTRSDTGVAETAGS